MNTLDRIAFSVFLILILACGGFLSSLIHQQVASVAVGDATTTVPVEESPATTTLFLIATSSPGIVLYKNLDYPFGVEPDPMRTPGAVNPDITQENISQTLCNSSWSTKSIRPPVSYTNPLKVKQIAEYGYTDTATKDYEEDHLISLELGGSPTDPENLWPEAYPVAKQKDTVENYLHKQLCAGAITLAQAQQEIATDWYAVYESISGLTHFGGMLDSSDPDDESP